MNQYNNVSSPGYQGMNEGPIKSNSQAVPSESTSKLANDMKGRKTTTNQGDALQSLDEIMGQSGAKSSGGNAIK